MQANPTRWVKFHKNLAQNYLKRQGIDSHVSNLPGLPSDFLEWIKTARPQVDGIKRSFLVAPFWIPIYEDNSNSLMILGGRQIYKSTYCTDCLAFEATVHPGVQVCYVSYDEPSLSAFSKQRLQVGTFLQNQILSIFPRHRTGNVHEISLKNGSTIYLTTDNNGYRHVEGKALSLCILDESQYHDIEFIDRVYQTMVATKGKIKILGIGGEAGSAYERLWMQTNQMEWIYDNPNWRDGLEFDEKGLVIGDYLKEVLKGKWVAQNPNNKQYHGYHLPQTIFATTPLTENDAEKKYKTHPRFSIEHQRKKHTPSFMKSHVLGEFYRSSRRPITREMVLACMEPYRDLSLLEPEEVAELKNKFGSKIKISMGVDFGSGAASKTAIAILIWWIIPDMIQIAWIEQRPQENQLEQAQKIVEMFRRYSCDIGVGDLGYGQIQVKVIQEGGADNKTGVLFKGLSDSNFLGCRTISDETKPLQEFAEKIDEHGEERGRLQIDKTSSIELLIESIVKSVNNPYPKLNKDDARRQKLMIPSRHDYQVDFLANDLTSITRKDFDYLEDQSKVDPRQRPKKQYNHPPDSVMALIYAHIALKHETDWHWISA